MLDPNRFFKKRMALLTRCMLLALPVIYMVITLSQTALAKNTYRISDGNQVWIHATYTTNPAQVLSEAGISLGKDDTFTTQPGWGVSEITVRRAQKITVEHDGISQVISSSGETVQALLKRLDLFLSAQDVISHPLNTQTFDGMTLTVSRASCREEIYTQPIAYETIRCYDASVPAGEEVVLTEGAEGLLLCTADVYYVNGAEVSRTVKSQAVTRQPVNRIVATGTYTQQEAPIPMPTDPPPTQPKPKPTEPKPTEPKPTEPAPTEAPKPTQPAPTTDPFVNGTMPTVSGNTLILADGQVLTFTKKLDCVATAYSCNGVPGYTYSGTPARVGAIAVDPNFIPLGTRMFIYTNDGAYIYGIAVAEDTGGVIKGNKIDLYFNTFDECWIFGVRDCTVYVLA